MINSISSMLNNRLRFTGISSGLDTDNIIRQLMKVESMKVEKVVQDRKVLEWRRDGYRSVTNLLVGFRSEYFDVLKASTNFRSATAFAAFNSTSSNENVLTVTAGTGATAGSFDVVVSSVASTAKKTGTSGVSSGYSGLTGANPVDMSKMKQGKEFTVTLDGVTKTIALNADYTLDTASDFATVLDGLMDQAFGEGKINVTESGGVLTFTPANASSTISIGDSTNTYLSTLGFSNGQVNSLTSGSITDFSGGNFKIAVDSDAAVDISVAAASDRDTLLANINNALSGAGLDISVKAIADSDNPDKIKFVTLDTAKKITFTAGESDDILAKLGVGSGSAINPLSGSINYSTSDIGKDFYITVDGTKHYIDLIYDYTDDLYTDPDGKTLAQAIQEQLDSGGITGVTVSISEGKISFSNPGGSEIKVEKGDDGLRDELGFSSTASSSRINLNDTLENIDLETGFVFDGDGNLSFTVNGKTFSANKGDTLSSVISKINTSDTGINIKYDSLNDRFVMETKSTGSTAVIDNVDNTGNFFTALKLDTASEARGTNATLTIDGTAVERTTNKFTIDSVAYDIKAVGTTTVNISVNPEVLVEKIKGFAAKYNEIIGKINDRLVEKQYREYKPLTDEQKSEMKDKDIELWEEKAKSGLLRNDPILQNIVHSMRKALYDKVDGVDISLHDIGITTSSNYLDRGKLVIDEEKLKQAIIDNPDKVTQLFTKESQYSYEDSSNRAGRYKESGLAQRLHDIIQDNVRTTRDSSGYKGILLEKAGIAGDITEFNSLIVNEIKSKDSLIDSLIVKLQNKENMYYTKFAAMERVLNQMNSQSAWLSQQFAQNQ